MAPWLGVRSVSARIAQCRRCIAGRRCPPRRMIHRRATAPGSVSRGGGQRWFRGSDLPAEDADAQAHGLCRAGRLRGGHILHPAAERSAALNAMCALPRYRLASATKGHPF